MSIELEELNSESDVREGPSGSIRNAASAICFYRPGRFRSILGMNSQTVFPVLSIRRTKVTG